MLILRVSRGWRLSTHIYSIYIWRRCHAGSEWSSHSRNAPPHARTHTTRTHAGPQTHAHAHSNPRIGHPASADRVGLAWHILSSVAGDQRVFAKTDMLHARICSCCLLMRPFVSPKSAFAAANASECLPCSLLCFRLGVIVQTWCHCSDLVSMFRLGVIVSTCCQCCHLCACVLCLSYVCLAQAPAASTDAVSASDAGVAGHDDAH